MSDSRLRKDPAGAQRELGKKCPPGFLKNWAKYDCVAMWGRTTLFVWGG